MKNYNSKLKIFIIIASTFYFLFSIFYFVNAQTAAPQFLVSWQAQSYVPAWYQGKIFPTKGTPIAISFELIDKGKIADLSKTAVRWYINDELVKNEDNGLGIKLLRFNMGDYAGQETEVRIAIPDYKGNQLDSIIRIPSKAPEVIIKSTYLGQRIQAGEASFEAIPYFFNIKSLDNLSFDWLANGEKTDSYADNPWLLKLSIDSQAPAGYQINLRAVVSNLLNQLELASRDLQLTIK